MLDFTEIPEANTGSGKQDIFELFAREFLVLLGFGIVQGPSRGADGGKDLVVEEVRTGIIQTTKIKWLVSCKHFAFSGRSVRLDDEKNVTERVNAADCQGFIGFYSTLPSSGLSEMLHRQSTLLMKLFDQQEIERHLLSSPQGRKLIERFFPSSFKKLKHQPAELFSDTVRIECENCGKDLLTPLSGIWVIWRARDEEPEEVGSRKRKYVDMYFACKGQCDHILKTDIRAKHPMLGRVYDSWDDIPDLAVPILFIKQVMGLLNGFMAGDEYESEAFDKMKRLLLAIFPFVSRHLSDQDQEIIERLQRIPSYLGGMGT